jgi:hypothetical protein
MLQTDDDQADALGQDHTEMARAALEVDQAGAN